MRIWMPVLCWMVSSICALAQVATVRTGEHDIFSRIVVEADGADNWQFGRTDDGYELSLGPGGWRFDLAGVFDRIPRNRLAGLWADPATGRLRLGIGCACHAIPFEFRPGIIVIDLKDGPPPAVSSFEASLEGAVQAALDDRPTARPRPRPWSASKPSVHDYNWLAALAPDASDDLKVRVNPAQTQTAPRDSAALVPLRDALLEQISKGMAEGVVDMAIPGARPLTRSTNPPEGGQMRIALGALPGLSVGDARALPGSLQKDGAPCLSDSELAIQDWGHAGGAEFAVSATLAEARAGLITEFDLPDPAAVSRSVRHFLYLGFGAEALQVLEAFPNHRPDGEAKMLVSLARLVDGAIDPTGPFPSMAVCDSSAALWAALAAENPIAAPPLRTDAVIRGFSALPAHLRQHLGPLLVERLLRTHNDSGVQAILEATRRAPGAISPEVAVMEVKLSLAEDRLSDAENRAQALINAAGPATAEALLALVRAQVAQTVPMSAETVTALLAFSAEHEGSDLAPQLDHALILAKVAAGDVDGGFALLPIAPEATAEAWRLLAALGSDTDILAHAVLPTDVSRPGVLPETALQLAKRLIGLGFSDAAMVWLVPVTEGATSELRLLAARAELMRRDARSALRALGGISSPAAAEVRAKALLLLGDPQNAAAAWAEAENPEAAARAQILTRDWAGIAASGSEKWQPEATLFASRLTPDATANASAGPLARSAALIESSQTERTALSALLAKVSGPDPLSP